MCPDPGLLAFAQANPFLSFFLLALVAGAITTVCQTLVAFFPPRQR